MHNARKHEIELTGDVLAAQERLAAEVRKSYQAAKRDLAS
jgi:hypothetical protein